MRRFLLASLFCFGLLSVVVAADTPGEEAVKDAIKTLKAKRAAVKDKADQALLDTAIKDLEERLAQVGKGEPEPKKDEAFVMPKGWELRFNTGKNRPTYDAKTGEMKLVYDFSDAKQLKDFEFDKDCKPAVQKGVLMVRGGEQVTHVVKFNTASVSFIVLCEGQGDCFKTSNNTVLHFLEGAGFQFFHGGKLLAFKAAKQLVVGHSVPVENLTVTEKRCSVTVGKTEVGGAVDKGTFGQFTLMGKEAKAGFSALRVIGTIDPEWAKEFFADKK